MGLKEKLFGLATMVGILLALVISFLLWHSYRVQESVRRFVPATEYLCNIAETRSCITRQMKEVMDFLALGEGRDQKEYLHAGTRAERAMHRWRNAIEEQMALGVPGEDGDFERYELIEQKYRLWLKGMADVYQYSRDNKNRLAEQKFIEEADNLLLNEIFVELDEALEDGLGEVTEAYHDLLLALGMLPWVAKEGTQKLYQTQATIEYMVAVSRLSTGLNRQITNLMYFLITGKNSILGQLTRDEAETHIALAALKKAHMERMLFVPTVNEFDLVLTLDRQYQQAVTVAGQLIDLKQQKEPLAVLAKNTELLETIFETELFPVLTKALQEGSDEIITLTSSTRRQGVLLVVAISFVVMLVSLRWVREMVASLHRIKEGIEIIGQGDLSHRINLRTTDELGELAGSFDRMVEKLQKSRNEVEQINASLEQRVGERTAQLETINRELEAFSYSVSHDLRGPLTQVNGLTQLLMYEEDEMSEEQIQNYRQKIISATIKMSQTIDDLLQLSRISGDMLTADYVELSDLASQIANDLQFTAPNRRMHWIIAPDLAAFGDRNLLRLALENLLGNAWKYTAQKDEAEVEFGQVEKNGQLMFFIRDNGAGFDMRDVGRVFLPFQRLHKDTEFSGSGIGLATVQRIIQRHGGNIYAEGAPGQGATFYFSIKTPPRGQTRQPLP